MIILFTTATTQDGKGLLAPYNIAFKLLIAKSGKPHTIGEEQIIPAISKLIRTVIHKHLILSTQKTHLAIKQCEYELMKRLKVLKIHSVAI